MEKVSTRIRCLLITAHFKISLEICMMQRKFSVANICSLVRVSFSWSIHCTVLQPKSTNCEKNLRDTSLIRIFFQNISGLSDPSIELILKVFFILNSSLSMRWTNYFLCLYFNFQKHLSVWETLVALIFNKTFLFSGIILFNILEWRLEYIGSSQQLSQVS